MTNTDDRIDMTANNDRRVEEIRRLAEAMRTPWMPAIVRRPPPKHRRNSVPHRAIR